MDEERKQILLSILNGLAISDRSFFQSLQQRILGEATARGIAFSSPTLGTIIVRFGEVIEERGRKIIEEMRRVLKFTRISDFTEARQTLRDMFVAHISAMAENAIEPIDFPT
jgi:hypothetical protein